jgi:5-methylcytosine-specific restriction endonuclease McrA
MGNPLTEKTKAKKLIQIGSRNAVNRYKKARYKAKKRILGTAIRGICRICLKMFPKEELTVDHIVPVFKGGTNDLVNLQLLCSPCHVEKGYEDWT